MKVQCLLQLVSRLVPIMQLLDRLAGATPPPAHVLGRSVGFQGLGMFLESRYSVLQLVQLQLSAVGISFIQFANSNSLRNLYTLGVSLFLGMSVPQYFNEFTASAGHGPAKTEAGWFNDILNSIFSSAPTVALMVAMVLDNTLEAKMTYSNRGFSWSKPFNRYDARNEEFYSFPIKVHEWMPTYSHMMN